MVVIRIYDDHDASRGSDNIEYASLCDHCAEERYVTYLSDDGVQCDECGSSNWDEDEEEEDY